MTLIESVKFIKLLQDNNVKLNTMSLKEAANFLDISTAKLNYLSDVPYKMVGKTKVYIKELLQLYLIHNPHVDLNKKANEEKEISDMFLKKRRDLHVERAKIRR